MMNIMDDLGSGFGAAMAEGSAAVSMTTTVFSGGVIPLVTCYYYQYRACGAGYYVLDVNAGLRPDPHSQPSVP